MPAKSYDRAEVVATIGELDEWLRGQKGYGMFGIGGSMRRLFAASMTLEDIQVGSAASEAGVTGAVTQVVVEELVVILMTSIIRRTRQRGHLIDSIGDREWASIDCASRLSALYGCQLSGRGCA